MLPISQSVMSLFLMILVGFYSYKNGIIMSQMNKGLTDILIQIALPFMIVSSFIFTYDHTIRDYVIKTFYYSLGAYLLMILISSIFLYFIGDEKKTILHFANVFPNTGYVGFPILMSIYGPEGVIYGSIFNMFFVVFLWTYGIILFEKDSPKKKLKSEIKKIILNPSIIAVLIGVNLMAFNISLPGFILSTISSMGNMTGPLSMIIIGGILAQAKITYYLRDLTIYYGLVIKLFIIPLLILFIFTALIKPSMAINSVVIMTAMPASAMTSILAENYNKERDYAAVLVSLSTLLSLITVPLLLKIMNLL